MISLAALPIQSRVTSAVRFSKRRTATRGMPEISFWPQETKRSARIGTLARCQKRALQNTRFQSHQVLEFLQSAQSIELRLFQKKFSLFESFFESLTNV